MLSILAITRKLSEAICIDGMDLLAHRTSCELRVYVRKNHLRVCFSSHREERTEVVGVEWWLCYAGTLHQPMVLSSSASTPPGNHPGWPKLERLNTPPTYAGHILPDHKSFYISLCPIIRSIYGLLLILRYRLFYISDEM